MPAVVSRTASVNAPTEFAKVMGREIAYRMFGDGRPIGRSTGEATYRRSSLALDVKDLADALGFQKFIVSGWSLGGIAAQVFTALFPERTSHTIIIGSTPPGVQANEPESLFFECALKPENTLEDECVLFFEPRSESSLAAAKASRDRIATRRLDRSPVIPEETFLRLLHESAQTNAIFDDDGRYASFLSTTSIPLLSINGDHDIVFRVENWYALSRKSLHVVTFPEAGHGPQHQFPEVCADLIFSFVRNV